MNEQLEITTKILFIYLNNIEAGQPPDTRLQVHSSSGLHTFYLLLYYFYPHHGLQRPVR